MFITHSKYYESVRNGIILTLLWMLLLIILLPMAVKVPSLFIYTDDPFLSNNIQSVQVQHILNKYFNIGNFDYLYVIINGTYNKSIQEIYSNIYLLNNAIVITPYEYYNMLQGEYIKYSKTNITLYNFTNFIRQLYDNLTELKIYLISHFQYFEYQLNVTFWLPLHNFSVNICPYYEYNFEKVNGSLLQRAQYAGYLTFKDPYLLYFSFDNYSNYTFAFNFLLKFDNYSDIVYKLSKINSNIERQLLELKNFEYSSNYYNLSIKFHNNNYWLFIIKIPNNESLTAINKFINNLKNAYVVGHLAYYAQSAYYTQNDIEIVDITTVFLVTILLIILVRSLIPILILITSASTGLILAYGLMFIETQLGYKIYYISGLVVPPIVFGLSIDYGILFIYRYFEELKSNSNDPLKGAFRNSIRGIVISGLSIVLGFLSFVISPSNLLRNIGIALVTSSISALIPAVFFVYSLLILIPSKYLSFPRKKLPDPRDIRQKYLHDLSSFSIRHNKIIVILTLLSIILLILYSTTIHTNVNVNEIIPPNANSLIGTGLLQNMYNYSIDYVLLYGNPVENHSVICSLTKSLINQGNLVYGPVSIGNIIIPNNTQLYNNFYKDNYTLLIVYLKYPVFSKGAINLTNYLIKKGFMVGGDNAQRIDIVKNTVSIYFNFTLLFTIILIIVYLFLILGSLILPLRLVLTISLSSLFGVSSLTLIYSSPYWLSPLIIFALLFSLGIDYDMFIIIRLIEEMKDKEFNEAIIKAVERTGLAITACGLILAGAFFSLMVADIRFLQEIGFGVGISIIFDTFIVRPILVPSILSVFKKYNFWPFNVRKFLYT